MIRNYELRILAPDKLLGLDKMNVNLSGNVGGSFEIKHTKTGFTPATSEDEVRRREGLDE